MKWKKLKSVDYIVVHCSATPEYMNIGVEEIRRWHRQRGWMDVGYHYIIRRDGTIEIGRPNTAPGAHARGFNHVSLGICLVGGVESDKKAAERNYTHAQWDALGSLIADLYEMYPEAEILGHRDLPKVNKDCPSFDVRAWWTAYVERLQT
jgi:N-acetyl-anhydromuramyl-L-alanine amidase AmpD